MSYITHGQSHTPEYAIWLAIKQRCLNSSHKHFYRYGGRGIKLCKRWMDFAVFIADMGWRSAPNLTIERRNNNGDYEPDNCYWAPRKVQANNTSSNRLLTLGGETLTVSQWADRLGVKANTVVCRLRRGLPVEKALSVQPLANNQWTKGALLHG